MNNPSEPEAGESTATRPNDDLLKAIIETDYRVFHIPELEIMTLWKKALNVNEEQ